VLGLLSLASSTFLIAITQREQVAQIFGKPVYVVTDVALVPLSSQSDANKAISASIASKSRSPNEATTDSDSDLSDQDDHDDAQSEPEPHDAEPETPLDDGRPEQQRSSSSTSIARDVIANRGQYGRFASQWFSRQGWGVSRNVNNSSATSKKDGNGALDDKEAQSATGSEREVPVAAAINADQPREAAQNDETRGKEQALSDNSIADALPKILRSTKMILTSRSYFFSYEFDLTRRLALLNGTPKAPSRESLDPLVSLAKFSPHGHIY
jgi:hypothetical protein